MEPGSIYYYIGSAIAGGMATMKVVDKIIAFVKSDKSNNGLNGNGKVKDLCVTMASLQAGCAERHKALDERDKIRTKQIDDLTYELRDGVKEINKRLDTIIKNGGSNGRMAGQYKG